MNDGYLEEKRKAIAETDKEIIILLKKRLDLATEIGQYKAQNGLEVRNLDVEQRVVDRYRYLAAEYGMNPDRMEHICRTIMQESVESEAAIQGVPAPDVHDKDPHKEEIRISETDIETGRKKMLGIGVASVAAILVLTAIAGFVFNSDNGLSILYLMAVPMALIALCFYLGYKDMASGKNAEDLRWIKKRTFIFGGLMIAITVLILALFMIRG